MIKVTIKYCIHLAGSLIAHFVAASALEVFSVLFSAEVV